MTPADLYRATDAPLRRDVARRLAEIARDVGRRAAETRAEGLGGGFVQNWPLSVDRPVAAKIRG